VRVLVEPRDPEDRRRLYRVLDLVRRVFKPQYVEGLRVVAGNRGQAWQVEEVLWRDPELRAWADDAAKVVGRGVIVTFFGRLEAPAMAVPNLGLVVLAADYGGLRLATVMHEVAHVVVFRNVLEEFLFRSRAVFSPLYDLALSVRKYVRLAPLPWRLVNDMAEEYLAYFASINYVELKRVEPDALSFIEEFYRRARGFIEYCYLDAEFWLDMMRQVVEDAKSAGVRVEPGVEGEVRAATGRELVDRVYRNPKLPFIAHESLSTAMVSYPARYYEEYRDVWG